MSWLLKACDSGMRSVSLVALGSGQVSSPRLPLAGADVILVQLWAASTQGFTGDPMGCPGKGGSEPTAGRGHQG